MNSLRKLFLKASASSELEYKKKLRKKQAEELNIQKMAEKVAKQLTTEYDSDHGRRNYTHISDHREDDLRIMYRKNSGLKTTTKTKILYKEETVFVSYCEDPNEFKPCGWIDTLAQKYSGILDEEEKQKKEKICKNWGLDRECDSELFNSIYGGN